MLIAILTPFNRSLSKEALVPALLIEELPLSPMRLNDEVTFEIVFRNRLSLELVFDAVLPS